MLDISKPGVYNLNTKELKEIEARYIELRRSGHAIILDEHFNSEARLEIIRIHHYRTCTACSEDKHGLTSV